MPPKPEVRVYDMEFVKGRWICKVEFHHRGQSMRAMYCTGQDGRGLWVGRHPNPEKPELCIAPDLIVPTDHQGAKRAIHEYFTNRRPDEGNV